MSATRGATLAVDLDAYLILVRVASHMSTRAIVGISIGDGRWRRLEAQ
jgi:hypothetical protein